METMIEDKEIAIYRSFQKDWNKFARERLNVRLDKDQQKILEAVQHNRRVSVRSGNARGKDFVAAVAALCFLFLNVPSVVIMTAPTFRQVINIMMAAVTKIYRNVKIDLGGEILKNGIKFLNPDRKLLAFKSSDYNAEAWTGFHSPHLMVIVTEASGIAQLVFNSIESILTGDSKLLIMFNPNQCSGEAWRSVKDPSYTKFRLSCLNAPNVLAKKTVIPGQVDYSWVVDKVRMWCLPIYSSQANESDGDFEFEGHWYRPNDLFRIKVLGEFPREGDDKLIPLSWIEAANQRWREIMANGKEQMADVGVQYIESVQMEMIDVKYDLGIEDPLRLGVDVAGMGRDMTVFCYRYDNFVLGFRHFVTSDHMEIAGKIKIEMDKDKRHCAYIDAIGEGAGVFSRLIEQDVNCMNVKFSGGAKKYTDFTGQRKFANMRAYCWWAIRDALDPKFDFGLALPPVDELTQDLNEPLWKLRSDGSILIEEKEEIKKRLGRSPDLGDALALTFYPHFDEEIYIKAGEPR